MRILYLETWGGPDGKVFDCGPPDPTIWEPTMWEITICPQILGNKQSTKKGAIGCSLCESW